jgi:hypothetical protein
MAAMVVVQMAIHQIVHVIPVRYRLMAAVWPVNVFLAVSGTLVGGGAVLGIRGAHLNAMIINMIAVLMVEVAIVQIIRVTVVLYSLMAAIGTMRVAMVAGLLMMWLRHFSVLSQSGFRRPGRKNAAMMWWSIPISAHGFNKFRPAPQ